MNIFLTGEIQVGKSTIINKFLDSHKDFKIGGFRTISNFDEDLGVIGGVYIISALDENPIFTEDNHVGDRGEIKKGYPDKFNSKGVEFLSNLDDCDLILMDEIGFMESKAKEFSKTVLNILDKDIPVIGVVKPKNKCLPLEVKKHPKTKLLTVTKENRDDLYIEFKRLLEDELNL